MLKIENIIKEYSVKRHVLRVIDGVSMDIEDGEIIAIVGTSGCGKTTFLKILAGILEPTQGQVLLNGEVLCGAGVERGMIFQNRNLFPWLTVCENIAFGTTIQKMTREEGRILIDHYLRATGLSEFSNFYPKDLSGGMQQRAAIARALANHPKILFMDEPFGSLDAQTRAQIQDFFLQLLMLERKTVVFVTHDVNEAILLADKVYVASARPMVIKAVHQVEFPRPRTRAIQQTKKFFDLANVITGELKG